jgi:polysaccharide export outer membrane protein
MNKRQIFKQLLIISMMMLVSCVSKKDITYFQNSEEINNAILHNYAPIIQVDDILSVTVSALDSESSIPFNLFQGGQVDSGLPLNYLVDINGNINFPVLGEVRSMGLTTNDLKNSLVKKLEVYIKNTIVNIRLENFRVTILGEVSNPGTFLSMNERITIPEAIGLAGDLTIEGKRKNILLVRNINGKVERIRLDLTDESIFTSPYYYLAQNDILYVEPNKAKMNSSALGTTSSLLSIAAAIISLGLILTR